MSKLFEPLSIRELTFPNRAWLSPMCQYSAVDGLANDWHLVHLGSRAVGGAGLILSEANAVSAEGRISLGDVGIWNDEQAEAWKRITAFVHHQGGLIGTQLAHAGRKASTEVPWEGSGSVELDHGGWRTVAPSAVAFGRYAAPDALTTTGINDVVRSFRTATRRALAADFDVVEIHAAHGYLLHQFLSPLSNHRDDDYGGSFENRVRLVLQVVDSVREVWPAGRPLFVRVSATDWVDGGWTLEDTVHLCTLLKGRGVDLVDCSSGGIVPDAQIAAGPGYQVPFAQAVRAGAKIMTGAVGQVSSSNQTEEVLQSGAADAVLLGRAELWDPYWPAHAARSLGAESSWPVQYERGRPE